MTKLRHGRLSRDWLVVIGPHETENGRGGALNGGLRFLRRARRSSRLYSFGVCKTNTGLSHTQAQREGDRGDIFTCLACKVEGRFTDRLGLVV